MIRLEGHKHLTRDKAIEKAALPEHVFISLLQHFGKPLDILQVKPGDVVKRGQCLATSKEGIFSPVHASISGVVRSIADYPHPVSGVCRTIFIESNGQDEASGEMVARRHQEVDNLSIEELREIVFDAGIVGLGGAMFPTHIKLSPCGPVEHFILNGAECEPYLTGDYRLMVERADELVCGIKLAMKMLKARRCYIAIEDDKLEAIRVMRDRAKMFHWDVVVLRTAYPQGGEKQVIKSCLGCEIPQGKFPFDAKAAVQNVGTVFAIYEAVYLRKPFYERVVTVSGTCPAHPKNLLVRLGTRVADLVGSCGPLLREPKRIIMGGPMMGVAQFTTEVPVIKGTSGVLFFDDAEVKRQEESPCIRCGECIENCPMGLDPGALVTAITKDAWVQAQELGAMECIECGLCAYLCPGRRNVVPLVKIAKGRIRYGKE